MSQNNMQTESNDLQLVVKRVGDQVVVVAVKEHLLQAAVEGKYRGTGTMD